MPFCYPDFIQRPFAFPRFFRVEMDYPRSSIKDVAQETRSAVDAALSQSAIGSGETVAVGVGSRGITHLPLMVKILCGRLQEIGAKPFIIPAMGSHGGATDEGQGAVLFRLGITAENCGAPVRSSLEAVQIGSAFGKVPVWFSKDAIEADHSVCINRIKPHTKFKAPVESGIFKMLCIGMGKHRGALTYHRYALKYGFYPLLEAIGNTVIEKSNFRFGIAVVEDAYDETLHVEGLPAERIWEREKALLKMAQENLPRIPLKKVDILVIRYIGKEISGAGMDPNITGRAYDLMEDDFSGLFSAKRIVILNLTGKTAGNAIGMGNADIITEKVFQKTDYEATVMNALTGVSLRKAFIPIRLPNDEKAIQAGFTTIGPVPPEEVRAVIIRDTRHLAGFWASEALEREMEAIPNAHIGEASKLSFDESGDILRPVP